MLVAVMRLKGAGKWTCRCDCGNVVDVITQRLRSGKRSSCGCQAAFHGGSKTRTYKIWAHMKARCQKPYMASYQMYGGRGIKVCDRWLKFRNFLADMGEAPPDHSIDRIDNEGHYCPENCRWATAKEQANNRRNNIVIAYKDREMTLAQWGEFLNINYETIAWRHKSGMATEKILKEY